MKRKVQEIRIKKDISVDTLLSHHRGRGATLRADGGAIILSYLESDEEFVERVRDRLCEIRVEAKELERLLE